MHNHDVQSERAPLVRSSWVPAADVDGGRQPRTGLCSRDTAPNDALIRGSTAAMSDDSVQSPSSAQQDLNPNDPGTRAHYASMINRGHITSI